MGFLKSAAAALAWSQAFATANNDVEVRQAPAQAKYCDSAQPTVCYTEFRTTTSGVVYRVAIPDVIRAPFDTLIQVVAPKAVGWAGLAWGGSMAQNPLTLVWMNGNQGVASSRWAT